MTIGQGPEGYGPQFRAREQIGVKLDLEVGSKISLTPVHDFYSSAQNDGLIDVSKLMLTIHSDTTYDQTPKNLLPIYLNLIYTQTKFIGLLKKKPFAFLSSPSLLLVSLTTLLRWLYSLS